MKSKKIIKSFKPNPDLVDRIRKLCDDYTLEYDEKKRILHTSKACIWGDKKIRLTYELIEDIEAYYGIKIEWLIHELFDVCAEMDGSFYPTDRNKEEIQIIIKIDSKIKTFYFCIRSEKNKVIYRHWIMPLQEWTGFNKKDDKK
jgi:hypothetical protein